MSTMVIAVGLVCGGMGAYLFAMVGVLKKRDVCPACDRKQLVLVSLTRGTTWPPKGAPADTSVHRCKACGAGWEVSDNKARNLLGKLLSGHDQESA